MPPEDDTPPVAPTLAPDAPATDTPPVDTPVDTGPASALDAMTAALEGPTPADADNADPGDVAPAVEGQAPPADQNAPPATPDPAAPTPPSDLDLSEREIDTLFKGRGKERVKAMHSELRELRPLREKLAEMGPLRERAALADQFEQEMRQSFTDPQAYKATLAVAQYINSGDPAKMRQAHAFLEAQARDLAQKLGIDGPGFDPVAADPRLAAAVEAGQITPELARELAAVRGQGQVQQQRTQAQEREYQAQQVHTRAVEDLNAFSADMQARDPQYGAKYQTLLAAIPAIQRLPPQEWGAAVRDTYARIVVAAPPAPLPAPTPAPVPRQPLAGAMPVRPTGTTSGMAARPKSAREAMDNALSAFHG